MVRRTITAIYEDGVFRPLTAIDNAVSEGQTVQITVEAPETPDELLAMARHVYKGLTEEEIDAIEQIALDRDASAIINDHTVVTNNTRHFDRIDGLRVENWFKS